MPWRDKSHRRVSPWLKVSFLFVGLAVAGTAITPARSESWLYCGEGKRITCLVDGDTFWRDGVKYRLYDINAPERADHAHCDREIDLAMQATDRLQELLNSGVVSMTSYGEDRYGRTLVTVETRMGNVSKVMLGDGLARPFFQRPYDPMHWCRVN